MTPQYKRAAEQILQMAEEDQAVRNEVGNKDRIPTELHERWQKVDRDNTRGLKAIIDEIGWPTKSKVGERASELAWLLAQHADHDPEFQKHCLALIKAEPINEVNQRNVAYLTDRVDLKFGKTQTFGTQGFTDDTGRWKPVEIKDEGSVDLRRTKMGLEPLAEYVGSMNSKTKRRE